MEKMEEHMNLVYRMNEKTMVYLTTVKQNSKICIYYYRNLHAKWNKKLIQK